MINISMRSQLIAGAAAIVGTSAIALAPVVQPTLTAATTRASDVALAAFANPVSELIDTGILASNLLTWSSYDTDAGGGSFNWPYTGIGDVINQALYNSTSLGYYSYVGLLPQLINDPAPSLQQLGVNLIGYVSDGIYWTAEAVKSISDGVWALPSQLLAATQQLIGGDFQAALTTLTTAIIAPITDAINDITTGVQGIAGSVVTNAIAVLTSVPQLVQTLAGSLVGGVQLLANKSLAIVSDFVTSLASLDVEGAWNAVVDGVVGPEGLPGLLLNLTVGPGVQTGAVASPDDIPSNFVPSIRTAFQATQWTMADALTSGAASSAAATPAPAAAKLAAAAAAAADETDSSAAADSGAGGGASTDSDAADNGAAATGSSGSEKGNAKAGRSDSSGSAHGKGHSARDAKRAS